MAKEAETERDRTRDDECGSDVSSTMNMYGLSIFTSA